MGEVEEKDQKKILVSNAFDVLKEGMKEKEGKDKENKDKGQEQQSIKESTKDWVTNSFV